MNPALFERFLEEAFWFVAEMRPNAFQKGVLNHGINFKDAYRICVVIMMRQQVLYTSCLLERAPI